tara:strand:+ start:14983 stop:15504 length:522 start_codon:yes stop_codon:yes gene_type:complete
MSKAGGPPHSGVSISWFADEVGCSRAKLRRDIQNANVQPCGQVRGNNVFRVKDLAEAYFGGGSVESGVLDPDSLETPLELQQFWTAQKAKIATARDTDKMNQERGLLLEWDDVQASVSVLLKTLREGIMLIPDAIEAEAGLSIKQRESVDIQIDRLLTNLSHSEVFKSDDESD